MPSRAWPGRGGSAVAPPLGPLLQSCSPASTLPQCVQRSPVVPESAQDICEALALQENRLWYVSNLSQSDECPHPQPSERTSNTSVEGPLCRSKLRSLGWLPSAAP